MLCGRKPPGPMYSPTRPPVLDSTQINQKTTY
jgi:hypothetical protein